jgi:GT2 family glycosyltransferase
MGHPLATVVIVNWNGIRVLNKCLAALERQTFSDFEILIIDNGSTDGSLGTLHTNWPQVRTRSLPNNVGFAAANNLGFQMARGKWIAPLNNDAFPETGWLASLLHAAEQSSEFSFFASCLLSQNDSGRIDGLGDIYHASGMAWRKGHGEFFRPADALPGEVFGPCAAAALFHRAQVLDAGGFDEAFFCYHEDVDLAFRLRLLGYRCLYVPGARVTHQGSASHGPKSDFVLYHGHRNLVWTYLKNMPPPLFTRYLPLHIFLNLATLSWFTARGQGRAIFRAKWDAFRGLTRVWGQRKRIQEQRRVSPSAIDRVIDRNWRNPYRDVFLRRKRSRPPAS